VAEENDVAQVKLVYKGVEVSGQGVVLIAFRRPRS
jgi:hypothetical protein